MASLLVLGTDTDAGKTTFCLTWLAAFADRFAYWKPLETGDSDTERIRAIVPHCRLFPPLISLKHPVAPLLAARRENVVLPSIDEIVARRPRPTDRCHLLIETFGSPWSPLDERHLQIDLIRRLDSPCLLVSSSRLGAIGRTLQCLTALKHDGIAPLGIVLVGEHDPFAVEQIERHQAAPVFTLTPPDAWTRDAFAVSAERQLPTLAHFAATFDPTPETSCEPCAATWVERDRRAVWHPYTSLHAPAPLVCVGAQDEFLHLEDGRRLIDGISSWWTIQHGHRDPELIRALKEATDRVDHVLFAGVTHPWGIELAEMLLASAALNQGRVFYSDNGSTAVEVALKLAYQYWRLLGDERRTRFVGFEHAYHGDTFGAMAVSRDPVFFGRFEPLLCQADILPLDPARLDAHLASMASETAAVIVEPLVQGAGGMRMHTPQTLADLYAVTRKHDVLFIADEVMTAGRTRTPWAFQAACIQPDLICAAKTIAGGLLPLAATLVGPHVVAPFDTDDRTRTFFHGHSFTAWPLACAVGLTNQRKLRALGDPRPPVLMEETWRDLLAPLTRHRAVRDLRILGSLAAVELNAPDDYLGAIAPVLREEALRHDVFLRPLGNVLYAMPPYCASRESLERIATAMQAAVNLAAKT